jgi:hypothetical protein
MNDVLLESRLRRVARRFQWVRIWRVLSVCWATAALVGCLLAWLAGATGWAPAASRWLLLGTAGVAALVLAIRQWRRGPDFRWVASRIEALYPELDGALLTAVQPDQNAADFLRLRVIRSALQHSQSADWRRCVPSARLAAMFGLQVLALGGLVYVAMALPVSQPPLRGEARMVAVADGVTISPGDASLEKGDSLVVLARFAGALPAQASLTVIQPNAPARVITLVKSLADPVFGGSVPEVAADFSYRLDYGGRQSREFKVTVYEHPRLVRADFDLKYPAYTRLPPRHIDDTRRVSAVEGTELSAVLQLNKPVRSAKFVARDAGKAEISLEIDPTQPQARLRAFTPAKSGVYDLRLVDADGRSAKVPVPFTVDVQPNRPPELRLASPRGDVRPSPLEEVAFTGTVWDDFGTLSYGLTYSVAGREPVQVELGRGVPARQKREFRHLLPLEEIGAKPDDLVSWHVWAEDIGPDGQPRRTRGDLFFGEIRALDEIFRESQDMSSDEDEPGSSSNQRGGNARRLAELQKQIISATWKLQRDGATPNYPQDAKVVRDSQEQALAQAAEALGEASGAREQAALKQASDAMVRALEQLDRAGGDPRVLAQALPAEQEAYQSLLRLQSRETNVTRRNRQRGGGGGGQQGNQRQIDQLDLKQSENRYETQRQARSPQNQERLEQLAVMNRLQELARRQRDLNERLKELQTALQEAKNESERDEIRRRLKRLQEEQRQMLADADEVRQRMDRAENQSALNQQRDELDRTREELQRAAEASESGSVAQALAAGTRAQRGLQQMREELRRQGANQFSEEMRELRESARELARDQEAIDRRLEEQGNQRGRRRALSESDQRQDLQRQLTQQSERMERMVDRARQLSEQAESSEPLLSRQLYDSIRQLSQEEASSAKQARDDLVASGGISPELKERLEQTGEREAAGKALEVARQLVAEGAGAEARRAGERARRAVEGWRRGVERAAESVLGDDAEQLKLAQNEIDQLTEQLQREIAGGGDASPPATGAATPGNQSAQSTQGPADDRGRGAGQDQPAGPAVAQAGGPGTGAAMRQEGGPAGGERTPQRSGRGSALALDDLREGQTERGGLGGWAGGPVNRGPLTSEEFRRWNDRLRDVEDLVESPELRREVAVARERARLMRRDFTQEARKPDWTVVKLQIVQPLLEVRNRLADELARREPREKLAPVDRDPVPGKFSESVRRYYEELGKP